MTNQFTKGAKYAASQNISRLALSKGHVPLFYECLIYQSFDNQTMEHEFIYNGEIKWFDDDFINTGKTEDNSLIFSELK